MQGLPVTGAKFTIQGKKYVLLVRTVIQNQYQHGKREFMKIVSSRHDLATNGEPKPQLRICIKSHLARLPVLHA